MKKNRLAWLMMVVIALVGSAWAADALPLAGEWRFALDEKKVGQAEKWFAAPFAGTVAIGRSWEPSLATACAFAVPLVWLTSRHNPPVVPMFAVTAPDTPHGAPTCDALTFHVPLCEHTALTFGVLRT